MPTEKYDALFAPDTVVSVQVSRADWLAIRAEITQLRGNLTLAEDGLASAMQENERLKTDIQELTCGDRKFVSSDTLHRELTGDPPAGQYAAVLKEAEKGEPVNTLDLIDALWWRVRNQRKEIARLHEKRRSSEPSERCLVAGCKNPPLRAAMCEEHNVPYTPALPHTTEENYEHFLAYSNLPPSDALRRAYYAGADELPPGKSTESRSVPLPAPRTCAGCGLPAKAACPYCDVLTCGDCSNCEHAARTNV